MSRGCLTTPRQLRLEARTARHPQRPQHHGPQRLRWPRRLVHCPQQYVGKTVPAKIARRDTKTTSTSSQTKQTGWYLGLNPKSLPEAWRQRSTYSHFFVHRGYSSEQQLKDFSTSISNSNVQRRLRPWRDGQDTGSVSVVCQQLHHPHLVASSHSVVQGRPRRLPQHSTNRLRLHSRATGKETHETSRTAWSVEVGSL
jgi:hypothetical protein